MISFGRSLKAFLFGSLITSALFLGSQARATDADHAASTAAADRYLEIRRLIKKNLHLSAHFVWAVDAATIKEVRIRIIERDTPILVKMLGDKDYGVASGASGLLATLGKKAVPALSEASLSQNHAVANHATIALRLIDDCYNEDLAGVMNPDVCPNDRPGRRH